MVAKLCGWLIAGSFLFQSGLNAQVTFTVLDLTPTGISSAGNSITSAAAGGVVGGFPAGQAQPANHAFLWPNGTAPIDLHPSFMDLSDATLTAGGNTFVLSVDSTQQVGYGFGAATFSSVFGQREIALRWTGSAASAEVLQLPFTVGNSRAQGTCDGAAVGYGETTTNVNGRGSIRLAGGPLHAVLWLSTDTLAADLHNGASQTIATSCSGPHQVGYGGTFAQMGSYPNTTIDAKAMMWSGSAKNFVWLHPPSGYATSQALAINGIFQAGTASVQFRDANGKAAFIGRPVMWTGTAASMVELSPPLGMAFVSAAATAVSSLGSAAGYGSVLLPSGLLERHALYWPDAGTPAIDLNRFLPAGYGNAIANGIDATGRIFGTAMAGNTPHAVMWVRN